MDSQLQELIDRIKSEGIDSAEQKASEITQEAERKARAMVDDAQKKATELASEAQKQAQKFQRNGEEALAQAARDLVLQLQKKIGDLFTSVIRDEVDRVFEGEVLAHSIETLLDSWAEGSMKDLSLLMSEKDLADLEASLRKKLAAKLKEGLLIQPSPAVKAGFRVSVNDGSAYYNFMPSEIADVLSAYLNPRLAELLKKAVE